MHNNTISCVTIIFIFGKIFLFIELATMCFKYTKQVQPIYTSITVLMMQQLYGLTVFMLVIAIIRIQGMENLLQIQVCLPLNWLRYMEVLSDSKLHSLMASLQVMEMSGNAPILLQVETVCIIATLFIIFGLYNCHFIYHIH